jgi:serine/threonine protein kinase
MRTISGPPKETPSAVLPSPVAGEEPVAVLQSFGDYELLGELGRGGMGVVYQARERQSGRLIALKMMLGKKADINRFITEARAAAELSHPGIVTVHSWGEHEGHPFFTMDYVPGETLSRILERGRLPYERAVRYMIGMARAVAAAHAMGIVHRDLKPSNVIIDPSDQPRILDFGLAKRRFQVPSAEVPDDIADALPADAPVLTSPPASPRTQRGAILGTPAYMAPEQAKGKPDLVGPPTDVHALGVLFYEMLTGRTPFHADNVLETLVQVEERQPPPLRSLVPHVPAVFQVICDHCLRKNPKDRYPNAAALADDLEDAWRQRSQGRRFARLTGLAAGCLLLLLLCQLMFFHWLANSREIIPDFLDRLANRLGSMIAEAWITLAGLFGSFLLIILPCLVLLATLIWSGVWVWHVRRAWSALAVLWVLSLAVWIVYPFLESTVWSDPCLYGAGVLTLVTITATLVRAGRPSNRPRFTETPAGETEPFLQRLFAVRTRVQLLTDVRPLNLTRVGLEDFEIGKVLHRWPEGQVCRARQKSLDRPVLVWIEEKPAKEIPKSEEIEPRMEHRLNTDLNPCSVPVPCVAKTADFSLTGVVVRHPEVLALHAVGTGKEGQFLVTESAAAVPLPEWLLRRALLPSEATSLGIRLARILQGFHEQGFIHGRLSAEWIMLRGELEPLLCPCGSSSQSIQSRRNDLMALGRLLNEWLSPRPAGWQRQARADVYRVADAAAEGKYVRARSLADDLERAARAAKIRWRVRLGNGLVVILALLPLLIWAIESLATESGWVARHLLLLLSPSAALLGYVFCRGQIQARRLRLRGWGVADADKSPPLQLFSRFRFHHWMVRGLVQLGLLIIPVAILTSGSWWLGLHSAAALVGYWTLGALVAGVVTTAEGIRRTLRSEPSELPSRE